MFSEEANSGDLVDENNVLFDKETIRRYQCNTTSSLKRVRSSPSLSNLQKYMSLLSRDLKGRGRRSPAGSPCGDIHSPAQFTTSQFTTKFRRGPTAADIRSERRKRLKGMSRPISIHDFGAWVKRSSSDSEFRFGEEFESMRDMGRNEKQEVGNRIENRDKNRYNNVLPYDYTRVKLSRIEGRTGSDYINANYIHGYKRPRAYIACQGPMEETTNDFWRMAWEQRTAIIIMITRCNERGKEKCHQYWPEQGTQLYENISVTRLEHELVFPQWIERKFLLECDGERRFLRHMQYTTWPDHGVPESPSDVLKFIEKVRMHQQDHDGPPICHCSAGVGRSGTYICIDILLNKLKHENNVDVYGVVCLMRTQRTTMVQTEEQYIFIHHVVLEHLLSRQNKRQSIYLQPPPTLIPVNNP